MKGKIRHELIDIIILTICAVICGADEFKQIEEYGNIKKDWLKSFLELPNGIPSHDTIGRVFAAIDPDKFKRCFLNWVGSVAKTTKGEVVAIDGKTLRRSHDRASNKAAIHMVSAWADENHMVLGQIKTAEKSNEITAIPELLNLLKINGCVVTIDAMGCQKKIAEKIIEKNADYALALKENQPNLYNDVKLFFEDALKSNFKDIPHKFHETTDGDHGRIEIRRYWTVSDIDWLCGKENWKKLNIIGMVESQREINGRISTEYRFYISSLENDAKKFGQAVRGHWGVENKLHWVLDIAFREDESRIRKGHAPDNFAAVRHIALNMIKHEKTAKVGTHTKRKMAGWDNDYLMKILSSLIKA